MTRLAALVVILATAVTPAFGAPPSKSTPLPPSATLFSGDYSFSTVGRTYSVPVSVPVDGAWLTGTGAWNYSSYPHWDCSHSYTGTLAPNGNDYAPLFIAGWIPDRICSMQFPVFGCLTCGVAFGGQKAYPGDYMTTSNTPGFMAAGTGTITLSSNNGGGQSDLLTFFLVEQVNRDAMVNMTIRQSVDEENPTPASDTEVAARYFIANSADRIPVVPVFHYGTESNGADRQFPAGPGIAWTVTWDSGAVTTVDERFAPQGLHGHSILAVSIPPLTTGTHTFTVKATLPSGKTYTSQAMSVLVYAQNICITLEGEFKPKAPVDQAPQFIPGSALNGTDLDLRSGPQTVQLNILVGRGSSGTFDVKLTNVSQYPGIAMNYPITGAATTPDMDFGEGLAEKLAVPIPKGGAPKVVTLPLHIRDYAASATIEVTMPYRKKTFVTRQRLPLDKNGNGMPDAGWDALASSATGAMNHVSDSYAASSDGDNDPVVSGLALGATGDGLSTAEEYRGFVVRGAHRRLHPLRKDLFVVIAAADEVFDDRLPELPLTLHELRPEDALGQFGPEINPNRASVPGASLQRGLRVRNRFPSPDWQFDNGQVVPADFEAKGYTFQQGDNVNRINATLASLGLVQSPNEALVCDVFDAAFWRHYISYGANGMRETHVAPTDIDFPGNQAIFGNNDWLQSSPNSANALGDDFQTTTLHTVCGSAPDRPWRALTVQEVLDLYLHTFLHETAHGVDIEHDRTTCSPSIMSDEAAVPATRALTSNDRAQIRLHRKHN